VGHNGPDLLALSFSHFDPMQTFRARGDNRKCSTKRNLAVSAKTDDVEDFLADVDAYRGQRV
jgi:hypothetical protein